jgi:hypothetical protein
VYVTYYKGGVDLSKMSDESAIGVTVNLLESGLLQLIKANENNVYEIRCDGSIPENVLVSLDGILFRAVYYYEIVPYDPQSGAFNTYTVPSIFQKADGDSIGIIHSDQDREDTAASGYFSSSPNSIYSSTVGAVSVRLKGTIKIKHGAPTGSAQFALGYATNLRPLTTIIAPTTITSEVELAYDVTIPLAANENLFLTYFDNNYIIITGGSYTLEFDSKYKTTTAWGITLEDLFKLLVQKATDGKYQGVSNLLHDFRNLIAISGMSLRNLTDDQGKPNAVIKTSLTDFFTSVDAILNTALGNEKDSSLAGEHLFLERKKYVFDPTSVTLSIGDVSDLLIGVSENDFFNNLKIGFPEQKYDEKQGNLEYNTTSQYNSPILKFTKDRQLISKYRSDSYGIEYTRSLNPGNNTVNNKSDNDVFLVNAELQVSQINATSVLIDTASGPAPYFAINGASDPLFAPNKKFTVSGTASNNKVFTVKSVTIGVGIYNVFVYESVVTEVSGVTFTFESYKLKRENYTSITGIVNPETAYNIEPFTPGRMVRAHGNSLRVSLHNQVGEYLKFLTSDKNKELATVLNGKTIIEKMDIAVSDLDDPLYYPYLIKFKTQVPLTFEQVQTGAANGHIHLTYNGVNIYIFPDELTVKPTLNDVQEWTGRLSPMTNLSDLQDLDINGLNFITSMGYSLFVPHLCPVKFVPLGKTLPAQYHFKHMDDWWFSEQIQMYTHQPKYFAKWQTNDLIKLQCQTNGLGPVQVELIDATGKLISTVALDQVSNPAISSPQILWEGNIDLSSLGEGAYYLHLTAGAGGDVAEMISEPLHVQTDWPDTLLIEYTNKKNKQAYIFDENDLISFRVEGWIDTFKPEATFTSYVNQPADIDLINGIPYRTHKLNIGFNEGHPDWVFDKVNRISLLNTVLYDGEQFSRDSDAKWEAINIPGSPLKFSSIQIRPSKNRDGISVGTDGTVNDGTALTVVYDIETNAFGDGAGSSNVVRVIKVDD